MQRVGTCRHGVTCLTRQGVLVALPAHHLECHGLPILFGDLLDVMRGCTTAAATTAALAGASTKRRKPAFVRSQLKPSRDLQRRRPWSAG